MRRLSGVFPVLPTPFGAEGAPDTEALLRLVDFALESGSDGIVFPGMASEVETLAQPERAELVAAVAKHVGGRVPFIVGASDADPAQAAARAREGAAAGSTAAMIMAPPRAGQDVAAQIAFYAAVAGACGLPIMLQNAPPPNGAGLSPAAIAQIAEAVPALRYAKEETLPCGQHVSLILQSCAGRIDGVFGGAGARYVVDELARGAAGTMPALELADVHVRLYRAWLAGDVAQARRLYALSLPLLVFQAVFRVRATKEVLRRRGLLAHAGARAGGPVPDANDRREIRALLQDADAQALFLAHRPDLSP
ncbi:MAG: dihydrodipicolinate synthase family protein [Hyphomicrobiales bacterium]